MLLALLVVALASHPQSAAAQAPFDPVAATEAYLAKISPEARARSDAYSEGGKWLALWGFLWGGAVNLLLLGSGVSARLRDWAERRTRLAPLRTYLYAVPFLVLSSILTFPLAVYSGFVREHKYGLSTQNFPQWLGDQGKGLGVGLVLGGLALVVFYEVLRRTPRTWWLWGTAVGLLFTVIAILISPVFIAPIFNRYTRLEDEAVKAPILSLARANGIHADAVYVVDASRQTTRISANVSGLFGTERITLNDNLLNRSSLPEIEGVMGHEIGHYVLHHAYWGILFYGLVLTGGFAFLRWSFDRCLRRWGTRWRVRSIADPAGLPLLGLLFSIYFSVLAPVTNTVSRTMEAEADLYGLNASREADAFAEIELKLSEYRKMSPGPIEEFFFFDHPSGRARILAAMRWKAENLQPE